MSSIIISDDYENSMLDQTPARRLILKNNELTWNPSSYVLTASLQRQKSRWKKKAIDPGKSLIESNWPPSISFCFIFAKLFKMNICCCRIFLHNLGFEDLDNDAKSGSNLRIPWRQLLRLWERYELYVSHEKEEFVNFEHHLRKVSSAL